MTSFSEHTMSTGRRFSLGLSVALLSLACAQTGWAQSNGPSHSKQDSTGTPVAASAAHEVDAKKVARVDARFLKDAAQAGIVEVEAGKLAIGKTSNPEVKAFAQQMVDDHTKVSVDLSALASSKGITLPTEPSLTDKAKLKILSLRDNQGFDQHYVKSFGVDVHEDVIQLFQKAAKDGQDADVKGFATNALAALQHHLQVARDLKVHLDKAEK